MSCDWQKVTLGASGLRVSPLGIGSSYGVGARDLERAFERGINFLFWGLRRTERFGDAIRTIVSRRREDLVVAVQSYSRVGALVGPSLEAALRRLRVDYVDLLVLGWWNGAPWANVADAAQRLKDAGRVRHLGVSGHNRQAFPVIARDPRFEVIMVRYNAAHTGAERDVFPHLTDQRPGVVSFTATRWGALLDPKHLPPGEAAPCASDCYRFVLSNTHVDACLAGPKNGAELDEALASLDRGPMSEDEMARMRRVGESVHAHAGEHTPAGYLKRAWKTFAG